MYGKYRDILPPLVPYDGTRYIVIVYKDAKYKERERVRRFKDYYRMLEYTDWVENKLQLPYVVLMKEKGKKIVDITLGVLS